MKSIILFRHGKSDWYSNYSRDLNRPLNQRGKKSAKMMGNYLATINEIPEKSLDKISFRSAVTRKFITSKRNKDGLTEMVRTVTDFDDFQVGDDVEHSIFGIGKIMALSGTGENQRVGVVFNDGTRKKLIVKFANLKKI